MIELSKLHSNLHAFSLEIIAESVRNLDLLKNAQPTQSQLNRLTSQMAADTAFAAETIAAIQDLNILVDIDGSIYTSLQQALNNTNQLCDEMGFTFKTNGQEENTIEKGYRHACAEAIAAADHLHSVLGILCTVVKGPIQSPERIVAKFFVI